MMKKETKKNEVKEEVRAPPVTPCFKCRYLHSTENGYRCMHRHTEQMYVNGEAIPYTTDGNTPIESIGIIDYMHSMVRGCHDGQEKKHDIQTA